MSMKEGESGGVDNVGGIDVRSGVAGGAGDGPGAGSGAGVAGGAAGSGPGAGVALLARLARGTRARLARWSASTGAGDGTRLGFGWIRARIKSSRNLACIFSGGAGLAPLGMAIAG